MIDGSRLTPDQVEALCDLHRIADSIDCQLMLIGATARLMQLDWPLNLPPNRTTKDVDFVVNLKSWQEYEILIQVACDKTKQKFVSCNSPHRLIHKSTQTQIDLVPFGAIEQPHGIITWPQNSKTLTVLGMAEAEKSVNLVPITTDLRMRIVDLPFLVLLKLFAWHDRGSSGNDDLLDADFILRRCLQLPRFEKCFWQIMEEISLPDDFDFESQAGAVVVAHLLKPYLQSATLKALSAIVMQMQDPYGKGVASLLPLGISDDEDEKKRQEIARRYEIFGKALL